MNAKAFIIIDFNALADTQIKDLLHAWYRSCVKTLSDCDGALCRSYLIK